MVFTDEEKDRANQHMMVQQRYELLKEEIINMQTFAETSGYVNSADSGGVLQTSVSSVGSSRFEVIQPQKPSIL